MTHAAIFDLDGTLVDSLPGIAASLNRALASRQHKEHHPDAVRSFIGNGSWVLCRRGIPEGLPDSEADLVNKAFMDDYDRTWAHGTVPYPGILELLDGLEREGIPLAVLSNKPHAFTSEIVTTLFGTERFASVLGHREGIAPKPDPAGAHQIAETLGVTHSQITFIGDSLVDWDTASSAGMQPVLVSWGYRPLTELRSTGAPLIHSAPELLAHLLDTGTNR
jgi:phosphoglycolate phosphatase